MERQAPANITDQGSAVVATAEGGTLLAGMPVRDGRRGIPSIKPDESGQVLCRRMLSEDMMNILTPEIKEKVQSGILDAITRKEYDQASRQISEVLAELYASIPDKNRVSYGTVYTIKVLSQYLYTQLARAGAPVYEVAGAMVKESADIKPRCVALGIISFYGLADLEATLGNFEAAAASTDWEMREIAQMLFRKLIAKHPNEVREFLLGLTASPDANLRRFAAETLRPVQENKWFYQDPDYPLSILRNMFKEPSPYPRTSVGNNLSDLARRLPDLVYNLVDELVDSGDENSYWIAYRACRNLVKVDPIKVMDLLRVDEYRYKKRVYRRSDS
jgi:3-methyladenine DNA glycosylase AlkC